MPHETASPRELAPAMRRIARMRGLILHAFLLFAALASAHAAWAAPRTEVTARFVFQLLKYVSWPPAAVDQASPFVVGVLGDEALAAALRTVVSGQQAQGHAVEVRSI